jgi:hypothetical protein
VKSTCVFVVWLSVYLSANVAAQNLSAVRALDEPSVEALAYGHDGSEAFRELVADIDALGVIVHVAIGDTVYFGTAGTTRLAGVFGGWRYLRVVLRSHLSLEQRASVLGHELQHVLEIARSSALTQQDVRALYDDIGQPVAGAFDAFETTEASEAGVRVMRELRSASKVARRQAAHALRPR